MKKSRIPQILAALVSGWVVTNSAFAIDLRQLPAAHSVQESKDQWETRRQLILHELAYKPLTPFQNKQDAMTGMAVSIARLATRHGVEEVNQMLLDPHARAFAQPGTDWHAMGRLCKRDGDYDFVVRDLLALIYRFGDDRQLVWPETRYKILHELLTIRGDQPVTTVKLGICGRRPETENHILMTESARMLTNQLLLRELREKGKYDALYDNQANGLNEWMLKHLQVFVKEGYSEYNSKPYEIHTLAALQNLYEFSNDVRVRTAAQILLDAGAAKFIATSSRNRRVVPFRRQKKHWGDTELFQLDGYVRRFIALAGNTELMAQSESGKNFGLDVQGMLLIGGYRLPSMLLDLSMRDERGEGPSTFFRSRHYSVEMVAKSQSFALSAGGIYINFWDLGTRQNDGYVPPTSLIPLRGGLKRDDFIRFEGYSKLSKRVNTCVAPGFACGENLVIPDSIPASCREQIGNFTFINFNSARCPLAYGFYVAAYQDECDSRWCHNGGTNFGFIEAAESASGLTYDQFKSEVLKNSLGKRYTSLGLNQYTTVAGEQIQFYTAPMSYRQSAIVSHSGYPEWNDDVDTWPLYDGEIVHASGDGLVELRHPVTGEVRSLDYRDALNPQIH